jgi:hypothetical protein
MSLNGSSHEKTNHNSRALAKTRIIAMNQPVKYDFLTHYRQDGLKPFTVVLKYASGTPINLSEAIVRMQLRAGYAGKLAYEFASDGEGDSLLTLAADGVIQFPEILSWNIQPSTYDYDLEVTASDGFVRTYLRGTWAVNQDITKKK